MPLSTACMQVGERTFHDALQSLQNHEKDGCGMVNGARSSPAPETAACRHNARLDKSFVGPRNPARQERSSTESVNSTGKYHSQQRSLFWACVIGALRGRCRNSSVHLPHCKAFVLLKLLYRACTCQEKISTSTNLPEALAPRTAKLPRHHMGVACYRSAPAQELNLPRFRPRHWLEN